ncbi:microcin C transport system permease protein [Martelella radicis]|uniref:Microcin C transport system permease protein n=2 Tax=Martelella radicis TaxID=1397476 RepID=A0A7W6KKV4_9HYPH|nr:microcin C transport system permease protein [Martelella radicis]
MPADPERIVMGSYILRRLLLMIPTLVGIMTISFVIVQFAPGGPVEQVIAELNGQGGGAESRISGGSDAGMSMDSFDSASSSNYRGAQGLDPQLIADLEAQFGFDKPPLTRFLLMMRDYLTFDFGESFFRNSSVIDLIIDKLPVSISLGIWVLLLSYGVSIPLGIRKAVKDGSRFDVWTSGIIVIGFAVPGFLLGILMIILFAGGSFFDWFPLRGLVSDNFSELPWWQKPIDYFWHLTLPLIALSVSSFATTTLLTKNSFIDEIGKQYVITARAKGLSERKVLYGHVFRNAMLIVIAGFPGSFILAFFTGSLLIENVFSLDGLGRLGYLSLVNRDYPVVFATLYIFSLLGLFIGLVSDLIYTWIDPRIDFEKRDV